MPDVYKVTLASLKSCLLNLPSSVTRSLTHNNVPAQNVVVSLSYKTKTYYAGWTGHTSSSQKIEMDPAYARNAGISEADEVSIGLSIEPREADVIWVEPKSADDWEIMELHASFLELNLLNQIRAVSLEHPLTIYLSAHTTATIVVKKIEPELLGNEQFAKISATAEVIVSPKTRQTEESAGATKARSLTSTKSRIDSKSPKLRPSVFLRALPDDTSELQGLNVFLPAPILRSALGIAKYLDVRVVLPPALQRKIASDTIAPPLPSKDVESKEMIPATKLVVRAHGVEDVPEGHIRLSREVFSALNVEVGSKIQIRPAVPAKKITQLTYHCLQMHSKRREIKIGAKENVDAIERFKLALSALGEGPVTHGLKLDQFLVGLQENGNWGTLPTIDKITFTKGEEVILPLPESEDKSERRIKGIENVRSKISKVISRSGGVLLYGSRGSGKSCIARVCARSAETHLRHTVVADCSKLSEERIPTIKDALNLWFASAAWYEPSIVFIDDLDRLCPAEVEHADSTRARQIAEIFLSLVRQYTKRHAISVLATAQSKEALHTLLTTSHIFDDTIALKPPDKISRRNIAESLLSSEDGVQVDWLEVANMTDGYLAGDLQFLTERAKHEALMREMAEDQDSGTGALKTQDYQNAIKGFTPASLRGIKLQKSTVEWKDIGGLEETRQILLETLEWPTRYAPIFANCPLRLRSGLLLYGYPGCGKTLLASAVASECGLNFISVKGPEILNKYIGASEKSVRDLFDRAQAAKPCVLFFDEFDSIAPKRGHDSTGVTDRVVNQMLTQMDGAEGLDGVYVLAATSRPDLIDPALLRPGRLDKSLLCNMPTRQDRVSILQALSRKLHIAPDIDLGELAQRTEGFSGADLQAVLYNAHLEAIHDVIAHQEEELSASQQLNKGESGASRKEPTVFTRFKLSTRKGESSEPTPKTFAETAAATSRIEAILANSAAALSLAQETQIVNGSNGHADPVIEISWDNLEKSLSSTKPSISIQERRRLDKVYHDFVDGRSADGLPDGQSIPGEQRATLA